MKTTYKYYTFKAICKDSETVNDITVKHNKS
jgi:hypothetical protein